MFGLAVFLLDKVNIGIFICPTKLRVEEDGIYRPMRDSRQSTVDFTHNDKHG